MLRLALIRLSLLTNESFSSPVRRFQLSILSLVVLTGLGTIVYMILEDMTWTDALYMTIITITTVGFGEVRELSQEGRMFTILLIVLGVGAATNTISNAVGIVLGPRLWLSIRQRNMERWIKQVENHYVVCGYGRMGRQVIGDLQKRGEPFVLIDGNPELEEELITHNIPFVLGDATTDEALIDAGITRARGLVATINTDAENVMTVLTARELNPRLFIVARVSDSSAESKLRRAGANEVASPYQIGGHRISLALMRPAVNAFLDSIFHFERGMDVDIGQLYVDADSTLAGQTVASCDLRTTHDVNILAIQRPDQQIIITPKPSQIIEAGTTLIIIGMPANVYELERLYQRG